MTEHVNQMETYMDRYLRRLDDYKKGRVPDPLSKYRMLQQATTSEEKTDIVLKLIETEGFLNLPAYNGVFADLQGVDLSRTTIQSRYEQLEYKFPPPPWWDSVTKGINLVEADADCRLLFLGMRNLQQALTASGGTATLHRVA